MALNKSHIIKKQNVLNELRNNNMTLQELRFFSIYLSKINADKTETRLVRFSLDDFQKIMNFGKLNIVQLKNTTNSLLSKVVSIPTETGGYSAFQLFKECKVDIDTSGNWFIEIDAHDKALPLMFEFKDRYFSYQLWNALRLKSVNHLRMYEILKQYEYLGHRVISVDEIRDLLGIDKKEYPRFDNFKIYVLNSCQEALKKFTDIKFLYEPFGKRGRGGKILKLKFFIQQNKNHENPLSLENFINLEQKHENNSIKEQFNKQLTFLSGACNNEFSIEEMNMIYNLLIKILPPDLLRDNDQIYNHIKRKYDELIWRASYSQISYRFAYLKKMLELEANL